MPRKENGRPYQRVSITISADIGWDCNKCRFEVPEGEAAWSVAKSIPRFLRGARFGPVRGREDDMTFLEDLRNAEVSVSIDGDEYFTLKDVWNPSLGSVALDENRDLAITLSAGAVSLVDDCRDEIRERVFKMILFHCIPDIWFHPLDPDDLSRGTVVGWSQEPDAVFVLDKSIENLIDLVGTGNGAIILPRVSKKET